MKLILENWRGYLTEQEEPCNDVVWHGSRADFTGAVRASQAHDVGGHPEQNLVAVYATENKKMAIYMSMVMPDENGKLDIFSDHEKDQLVVVKGKIRRGEQGYLYKMPKTTFRNTGVPSDNPEWVSEKDVEPCDKEVINVDSYLELVREATPEDIKFWNKHNKTGEVSDETPT